MRGELARLRTADGGPVRCSIGLVTFDRPPTSLKELVAAGDELLYRAKENGKDRIEQAERSGSLAAAGRQHRIRVVSGRRATPRCRICDPGHGGPKASLLARMKSDRLTVA